MITEKLNEISPNGFLIQEPERILYMKEYETKLMCVSEFSVSGHHFRGLAHIIILILYKQIIFPDVLQIILTLIGQGLHRSVYACSGTPAALFHLKSV